MEVISSVDSMSAICRRLVKDGKIIRFVPTMGALHEGHAMLIRHAINDPVIERNGKLSSPDSLLRHDTYPIEDLDEERVVIVSIFVNSLQFSSLNDHNTYPKTIDHDIELCRELKVHYLFIPKRHQVYPKENCCCLIKPPEELGNVLEGTRRPGHFEGMLTVVCKLFNIIMPNEAYFGEKDYQQLVLVKKMVRDLNMRVEIKPVLTVRDENLLPLSSRNSRISAELRPRAAYVISQILHSVKRSLQFRGTSYSHVQSKSDYLENLLNSALLSNQILIEAMYNLSYDQMRVEVEYLELRCSEDFSTVNFDENQQLFDCSSGCLKKRLNSEYKILKCRLLITVSICSVRLLDNIEIEMNKDLH